mmetsp:Transcript_111399/g.325879  ORF Transcript_111399/g.325879 Transcript_111399/m.325879 type:complete len:223 (+) Transcript_111399:181-849(+)
MGEDCLDTYPGNRGDQEASQRTNSELPLPASDYERIQSSHCGHQTHSLVNGDALAIICPNGTLHTKTWGGGVPCADSFRGPPACRCVAFGAEAYTPSKYVHRPKPPPNMHCAPRPQSESTWQTSAQYLSPKRFCSTHCGLASKPSAALSGHSPEESQGGMQTASRPKTFPTISPSWQGGRPYRPWPARLPDVDGGAAVDAARLLVAEGKAEVDGCRSARTTG